MAVGRQPSRPVAHGPVVLGVVRKLHIAALSETCCPPHPAHILSCGPGVQALRLAMLEGPHALYKVGARVEERGLRPLLQDGRGRAALHDDRRGQMLDPFCAAQCAHGCGVIALKAWEVYALSPPGLPQDTTTSSLSGA
jgi:hypothetical protein